MTSSTASRRRALLLFVLGTLTAFGPLSIQALGGAAGAVIARAIVRDLYSGREIARVLSVLMLIMGAAPILAPLLGGQVLSVAGWRAIFGVLTVLGTVALVLVLVAIPGTPPTRHPGAASLGINLRVLLTDRRFLTATFAGGFAQSGLFAYISGAPFVFMEVLHVSPKRFAGLFALNALGYICVGQLNRRLLARRSPEGIAVSATLFMVLMGAALLVLAVSGLGRVYTLAPALFLFIASLGLVMPNAAALAMEEHGARAGAASAVLGSLQFAVSAAASASVGLFNDGSMLPMAAVMAVCASGACMMALGVPATKQDEGQEAPAASAA